MWGALALALVAAPVWAQSQGLLDAVRVHAPRLAERARTELDACESAKGTDGKTRPCPERARLSLLTGVLTLSEGDPRGAAAQLTRVPAPKGLEAFHAWYLGEAQAWAQDKARALVSLGKAQAKAPPWLARRVEVRIAELQLELGQATKARPVLEQYAAETPTAEALLARAYARLATGAGAEGLKDLRTIVLR
ncbi:MAG: lytic transglycosylase, partial [Myxococcaceae bacterium]|nr:lytic transglycosylase [Myxococcaceae bacterium]